MSYSLEFTTTDCCVTYRLEVEFDVRSSLAADPSLCDVEVKDVTVLAAWLDIDGERHNVQPSSKGWKSREEFFVRELQTDRDFCQAAVDDAAGELVRARR